MRCDLIQKPPKGGTQNQERKAIARVTNACYFENAVRVSKTHLEQVFRKIKLIAGNPSRLAVIMLLGLSLIAAGCAASATDKKLFFGKTEAPRDNVMRYVSGSEPEALDPAVSDGQPEARIYMALYEGLVEYDPKTATPIPALAERWEVNKDFSELTFHLRHNGRFSNGDAITAADFVYTIQRGLTPKVASRNAGLAYYIKYAQAYNEGAVFVQDPANGQFLLAKDFEEEKAAPAKVAEPKAGGGSPKAIAPISAQPAQSVAAEYPPDSRRQDARRGYCLSPVHAFTRPRCVAGRRREEEIESR